MHRPSAGGSRTLWLIRHGESSWNARRLVQGHANRPRLTLQGHRQARRIARSFEGRDIAIVYSSDLRRAAQTATILARRLGVDVRTDPRLRERNYGIFEGRPSATLRPLAVGIDGDRIIDIDARIEGGESLRQLAHRSEDFVAWLRTQAHPSDVVVVTHGGTVRALRASVLGVPIEEVRWDPVPNGSVLALPLQAPRTGDPLSLDGRGLEMTT